MMMFDNLGELISIVRRAASMATLNVATLGCLDGALDV
jgi:hypothetical protein